MGQIKKYRSSEKTLCNRLLHVGIGNSRPEQNLKIAVAWAKGGVLCYYQQRPYPCRHETSPTSVHRPLPAVVGQLRHAAAAQRGKYLQHLQPIPGMVCRYQKDTGQVGYAHSRADGDYVSGIGV